MIGFFSLILAKPHDADFKLMPIACDHLESAWGTSRQMMFRLQHGKIMYK